MRDRLETNATLAAFQGYQNLPVGIDATILSAVVGFFTSKGFDQTAAESIGETLVYQAKIDGYNVMQILDTLKGLSNVEISGIVAEILNFNRYKTSTLGYATKTMTHPEIERNLIA
jgi:hypothetical protein